MLKLTAVILCCVPAFCQSVDYNTQVKNTPRIATKSTNFIRTNGLGASGNLATPGSSTVVLTPCPAGIAGTHTVAAGLPHKLYVSGGVGIAETVSIAGGSGVAPDACTLTFTTANAHTGAWSVGPVSGGLQEAIYVAGAAGAVLISASSIDLYGTTYVPDGYNTPVHGLGKRATTLTPHGTTGDWLVYDYVSQGGSVDTGDYQIIDGSTHTSGTFLKVRYRADGRVSNILTSGGFDSVYAEGNARVIYDGITIYNYHNGLTITCAGVSGASCSSQVNVTDLHVTTEVQNGHGLHVQDQTTGLLLDRMFIEGGISPVGAANYAAFFQITTAGPLNEIILSNSFLDSHSVCLNVNGNSSGYQSNAFQSVNNHIACANYGISIANYVENFTSTADRISAVGSGSVGNSGGILLGTNTRQIGAFSDVIDSDGQACLYVTGVLAKVDFIGNTCGKVTPPSNAIVFNAVVSTANVKGNTLNASGTVYVAGATPTNLTMVNNTGIDDVIPVVASASTLAFPVNPHFTVSGTTGAGAVTFPLISGSSGTLITTGGTVTFTAGATIGNTLTSVQNVPVYWTWDGTHMWFK